MIRLLIIIISIVLGLGILGYFLIQYLLPSYTITSWWRTPLHNKEVGGVWNSRHLIGWGYDIAPQISDPDLETVWFFPTKIQEGNHTHLGWAG